MSLNKNGVERRKGSGRTKGASSLVSVKLGKLTEKFKAEDIIVVGRVFLRKAGIEADGKAVSAPVSDETKAGITVVQV